MKKFYVVACLLIYGEVCHPAPANKVAPKKGTKPPIAIERQGGTQWYDTYGRVPSVWAGEDIHLRRRKTDADYDGNYSGDWSITGKIAREYEVTSAKLELHEFVQKGMQDVEFFWAESGRYTAATRVISSSRPPFAVAAAFSVKKPKMEVTGKIGVTHWNSLPDWHDNNISLGDVTKSYPAGQSYVYPTGGRGMEIKAKKIGEFPATGQLEWVQIVTKTDSQQDDNPMQTDQWIDGAPFYPHKVTINGYDSAIEDYPAMSPVKYKTSLDYYWHNIFRRDYFTTWLIFRKDDDSDWVPIKSLDWFWQGRATHPDYTNPPSTNDDNHWVVSENSQNAASAVDTNIFPKWPLP